jgi:hypothetical protein
MRTRTRRKRQCRQRVLNHLHRREAVGSIHRRRAMSDSPKGNRQCIIHLHPLQAHHDPRVKAWRPCKCPRKYRPAGSIHSNSHLRRSQLETSSTAHSTTTLQPRLARDLVAMAINTRSQRHPNTIQACRRVRTRIPTPSRPLRPHTTAIRRILSGTALSQPCRTHHILSSIRNIHFSIRSPALLSVHRLRTSHVQLRIQTLEVHITNVPTLALRTASLQALHRTNINAVLL